MRFAALGVFDSTLSALVSAINALLRLPMTPVAGAARTLRDYLRAGPVSMPRPTRPGGHRPAGRGLPTPSAHRLRPTMANRRGAISPCPHRARGSPNRENTLGRRTWPQRLPSRAEMNLTAHLTRQTSRGCRDTREWRRAVYAREQ